MEMSRETIEFRSGVTICRGALKTHIDRALSKVYNQLEQSMKEGGYTPLGMPQYSWHRYWYFKNNKKHRAFIITAKQWGKPK
jgi:hypothetical protein